MGCDQPARIPSVSARSRYASSQIGSFATSGTMTRVLRAAAVLHRPASGSTSTELIARVHSSGTFGPSVDSSNPAIDRHFKSRHLWAATETVEFYFAASSGRQSVWTLVRQLRGPHLRTWA